MATAPWRCSQCGTVNEPDADSCRTCGKWPSLFDLEDGAFEGSELEDLDVEGLPEPEPVVTYEPPPAPEQTREAPEPVTVEIETYEEAEPPERRRRFEPPPTDPVFEEGEESRPRWVSWLIPIAFLVYFAISLIFNNR
jgi:hypothetical protein